MAEREGEEAGGRKRRGRVGCERDGVKGSMRLEGVGFGSARGKVEVQESAGRGPGGREGGQCTGWPLWMVQLQWKSRVYSDWGQCPGAVEAAFHGAIPLMEPEVLSEGGA